MMPHNFQMQQQQHLMQQQQQQHLMQQPQMGGEFNPNMVHPGQMPGYPGMSQAPQAPTQQVQAPPAQQAPPASQAQHQNWHNQQRQQLQVFWQQQSKEIETANDFNNHMLPLARIKKIMKSDEEVRMIAAESPVVFAKACEMFILELTLRSWSHAEENKRRTLQRNDIAAAITKTDIFDFLVDIVPHDDLKEEGIARPPAAVPPPDPNMGYSVPMYYPMQPGQHPQMMHPGQMQPGQASQMMYPMQPGQM
eukprot:439397-Pyramimonas_sp.AAC.1